jgi:hypothetical protein
VEKFGAVHVLLLVRGCIIYFIHTTQTRSYIQWTESISFGPDAPTHWLDQKSFNGCQEKKALFKSCQPQKTLQSALWESKIITVWAQYVHATHTPTKSHLNKPMRLGLA